jgi:hypothetical protein
MKKWKYMTLPGLELRTFCRPARNQSLYWLRRFSRPYIFGGLHVSHFGYERKNASRPSSDHISNRISSKFYCNQHIFLIFIKIEFHENLFSNYGIIFSREETDLAKLTGTGFLFNFSLQTRILSCMQQSGWEAKMSVGRITASSENLPRSMRGTAHHKFSEQKIRRDRGRMWLTWNKIPTKLPADGNLSLVALNITHWFQTKSERSFFPVIPK